MNIKVEQKDETLVIETHLGKVYIFIHPGDLRVNVVANFPNDVRMTRIVDNERPFNAGIVEVF